jgi:hypothetical protein
LSAVIRIVAVAGAMVAKKVSAIAPVSTCFRMGGPSRRKL